MLLRAFLGVAVGCAALNLMRTEVSAEESPDQPPKPTAEQLAFFEKKVRPLLIARCTKCHNEKKQQGGLSLDSAVGLHQGGDSGPVIDRETLEDSLLLEAISYSPDAIVEMPPDGKLKPAEIALLTAWVKMGAPWPASPGKPQTKPEADGPLFTDEERNFWAFQPPRQSELPQVEQADWPREKFDHFVLSKLNELGLKPAPEANKRDWIRRATFDLCGLPPTPDEIDAFLADDSPQAHARVIDRLLESPRYGERWGRHWLDVARYADSNGMDENLAYANAFRFRDYVIAAFNKDKPYDQFIREQIAGDLLPVEGDSETTIERQVATGFLAIGPKMLAEDDPLKMRVDIVDEQIDTIGRAFLGMTLGCARCHAHKFDPIPQEDYYSLAGIFMSTKTMENYKVVANWYERPLAAPEVVAARDAQQKQIDAGNAKIKQQVTTANENLLATARGRVGDYLLAATAWNRYRDALGTLTSVMAQTKQPPAGGLVIEAENFARGNVNKDFSTYGQNIGVLVNAGKMPNFVEYDIDVPQPGTYQLEIRLSAVESRPVELSLSGAVLKGNACEATTGSWTPESQKWTAETAFFAKDKLKLRLERNGPFPHIDKLALVPISLPEGVLSEVATSPEQLAAKHDLHASFIVSWADYLKQTKDASDSVFASWHRLNAPTTGPSSALFDDFYSDSRKRLADRYQELFADADRAWRELKQAETGKKAEQLTDPAQEALRKVIYDDKGPFALPKDVEKLYSGEVVQTLAKLRQEVKTLTESLPELPHGMGVTEGKVENTRVNIRGNHINLGAEVPRRFLRIMSEENQQPLDDSQSGRLQMAEWLTSQSHPLTARVMVNRVWRWHFGEGIVPTPDNFGTTGERPINQPLLDWLAVEFMEDGWSLKNLHRRIMLSATYRMSTQYDEKSAEIDPPNRYLWRMNRRRLSAEEIRDGILAVAGTIDFEMGGTLLKTKNHAYVASTASVDGTNYDTMRRSIYLPVVRSALFEMFSAFDFPDPSASNGHRATTTVAPQALFMLNSQFMEAQTKAMAQSLLSQVQSDDLERMRVAYRRALGREPNDSELERAMEFLASYDLALADDITDASKRQLRSWQGLCRVLLASSDFVYVD